MSNTVNDLILTDVSGFAPGDSLTLGSGLTGIGDSAISTATGAAGRMSVGDGFVMDGLIGSITSLSTLSADVTYSSAVGGSVTATMTLLVIEVTDPDTGIASQMLVPFDSNGDLVNITSIDILATNTTPGMTEVNFANIDADDTVTLATPGTVDGTDAGESISVGYTDTDGDTASDSGSRIDANGGNDTVYGGIGDDTINGGAGNDWIFGGAGNDLLSGNDGNDSIWGDAGDDTLYGNEGDDKLIGGEGNDLIIGGEGNNILYGDSAFGDTGGNSPSDSPEPGYGNDTLVLGNGDDTAYGGSGDDTFDVFDGFGNHEIVGGETGETIGDKIDASKMTLDTTLIYTGNEAGTMTDGGNTANFAEIENVYMGSGTDTAQVLTSTNGYVHGGSGFDTLVLPDASEGAVVTITGTIDNGDGTYSQTGYVVFKDGKRLDFESFEKIICFAPGTLIDTLRGRVAVEDLVLGDKLLTRDHGYQEMTWMGRRDMTAAEMAMVPAAAPVRIAQGALGRGLPERDLVVSPRHRMLISGPRAELMFGESEVLVAAVDLMGLPGVSRIVEGDVSYLHIMCARHEIIRAEGSWTESFQPALGVINALEKNTRAELLGLFPELATEAGIASFGAARPVLSGDEARALFAA
ncbi:Hint domain-containing protein [Cereibacter sphaeroides]|nr:Hint domain-containing protein [Cereibacter sphaeroides]